MTSKRVHILSVVNAGNVSKDGSTYTILDVVGAVDDIVMNSRLYPADQLKAAAATLEGKPAPAGHPKNSAGQAISALNGEALASAWIGSYVRNARHEAGRTIADVVVNEAQARAHPDGAKLIERLDAAIAGNNAEPIHVSTGLMMDPIIANGESLGKRYSSIVTNIRYDHLAILLNEQGAATPDQGVGMFLNSAGEAEQVEEVVVNTDPEDMRTRGLLGWIKRLIGNESEMSFDDIAEKVREALPQNSWLREVYSKYVIYVTDIDGRDSAYFQQDYAIDSSGSVSLLGSPVEVTRRVEYKPVETNERTDAVKQHILAALNAAGINSESMDESALLSAYNSLITKPQADALTAANAKIAQIEANAQAAEAAELDKLSAQMAVNSALTADDLKALGLKRLREIQASTQGAAPVLATNAATKTASEFAGYSINQHLEA
jgi:hypothetical protein